MSERRARGCGECLRMPGADGRRAVSFGMDGFARVWELETGRPLGALQKGRGGREFSAWTGTINASRISGDASFGKATFK